MHLIDILAFWFVGCFAMVAAQAIYHSKLVKWLEAVQLQLTDRRK